jgi:thiol-disulfide isomerase/thioredoxin
VKKRIPSLLAIGLLVGSLTGLLAAETNQTTADLNDLLSRINAKLSQGKTTETDLAGNLKEFDALLLKHKAAPVEERAPILIMKARLCLEVLDNPEAALDVFRQIQREIPAAKEMADGNIAMLERAVSARAIQRTLVAGTKFPDFDEKDLAGHKLSVSQFKGKVVLVDFWGTWCPPCVMELPALKQTYDKYHARGFEIIGVALDENRAALDAFLKRHGTTWPQFNDGQRWANKLALKYGVTQTPTSFLLDREGKIIAKDFELTRDGRVISQSLGGQELEQVVAKAVAAK